MSDEDEEWEWTTWQQQNVPDRDAALTVEFYPLEPDVLELPDGSEIWFYPKFGFMRDR